MNLTLHYFKKDVRHLRVLLGVWLLLVALRCALMGTSVPPDEGTLQAAFFGISLLIVPLQALLLAIIAPLLIQEESLVGTTAFWFTRPISPSGLLASKAAFLGLLAIVPTLAAAGVLMAHQVTWHDTARAVPEILISQLSYIVCLAVLASLTPNVARFMIVGVILFVTVLLVSLGVVGVHVLVGTGSLVSESFSLLRSRGIAKSIVLILGGCALAAHQYLTRRTARSVMAAAVLVAATFAIGNLWPWDFLAPTPLGAGGNFNDAAVKLTLGRSTSVDAISVKIPVASGKTISCTVDIAGLPDRYVAEVESVDASLRRPDGGPIRTTAVPNHANYFAPPDPASIESALGGTPIVNARSGPRRIVARLFGIGGEDYGTYSAKPLVLSADLTMTISEYRVTAEMPLRAGMRYDNGSVHEIIANVRQQGDSVEIVLRKQAMQLLFDRSRLSNNPAAFMERNNNVVYVLRNAKRHEAISEKLPTASDLLGSVVARLVSVQDHPLVESYDSIAFGPETMFHRRTPTLDEAWLADAELVRLERVPIAEFSRSLVVEKFRLKGEDSRPAVQSGATAAPDSKQFDRIELSNPSLFAQVELPANATRDQVKSYINNVLLAADQGFSGSPDRSVFQKSVEMLAKVGPRNLDLLIAADTRQRTFEISVLLAAANQVAGPGDEKLILQELAVHPALVATVVKFGWQNDARDILVAGLKDESHPALPLHWLRAVAAFGDPSTYPDLKAYLVRCSNRAATYAIVRRLPGLDLTETVSLAWKKAQYGLPREVVDAAAMAGGYGHADVLDALSDILRDNEGTAEVRRRAAAAFRKLTPATGNDTELVAWFDAHQGRLAFDPSQKKFVAKDLPRPSTGDPRASATHP